VRSGAGTPSSCGILSSGPLCGPEQQNRRQLQASPGATLGSRLQQHLVAARAYKRQGCPWSQPAAVPVAEEQQRAMDSN